MLVFLENLLRKFHIDENLTRIRVTLHEDVSLTQHTLQSTMAMWWQCRRECVRGSRSQGLYGWHTAWCNATPRAFCMSQEVTWIFVQRNQPWRKANFSCFAQCRFCNSNKCRLKLKGRGVIPEQQTPANKTSPRNRALNFAISELHNFLPSFLFISLFQYCLYHFNYLFWTFSPFRSFSFHFFIPTIFLAFVRYTFISCSTFPLHSLIYLLLLFPDPLWIFLPFFRFSVFNILYMHICLPVSPWSRHFFSPFLFISLTFFLFLFCSLLFRITFYIVLFFTSKKTKDEACALLQYYLT
jgi:hypothetical protein